MSMTPLDISFGETLLARRTQSSLDALDRKPVYECDPCEESGVRS